MGWYQRCGSNKRGWWAVYAFSVVGYCFPCMRPPILHGKSRTRRMKAQRSLPSLCHSGVEVSSFRYKAVKYHFSMSPLMSTITSGMPLEFTMEFTMEFPRKILRRWAATSAHLLEYKGHHRFVKSILFNLFLFMPSQKYGYLKLAQDRHHQIRTIDIHARRRMLLKAGIRKRFYSKASATRYLLRVHTKSPNLTSLAKVHALGIHYSHLGNYSRGY